MLFKNSPNDINIKSEELTKIQHFSFFCLNPRARTLSLYIHEFGMLFTSVDGVTVSIGAFQALVPGSTPGRRIFAAKVLNDTNKSI